MPLRNPFLPPLKSISLYAYPCLPIRSITTTTPHLFEISTNSSTPGKTSASPLPPRWLSDIRSRVGKCIYWGLTSGQLEKAGSIMKVLAKDWRELVAGSEGFLTERGREGLRGHGINWGDMDSMGHVNNVQYVRYAESGRIKWAHNFATFIDPVHKEEWSQLWTPKGNGLILKSIRTDYKFPMTWPDRISVYHKLHSLPNASSNNFFLDVIILSEKHQRASARCVEDIVVYDYKKGKKGTLEPFMAEAFSETWKLQEEAKRKNVERVHTLLGQLRELEKESWDREGAVEDLGSAGNA